MHPIHWLARPVPYLGILLIPLAMALLYSVGPLGAQEPGADAPQLDSIRSELEQMLENSRAVNAEVQAALARSRQQARNGIARERQAMIRGREAALRGRDAILRNRAADLREREANLRRLLENARVQGRSGLPPAGIRAPGSPEARGPAGSPGSPLVMGQRVIAGAAMTGLTPQLATYFGVESGVLVTEVPARSPAADAGLLPGDVIVAVSGEGVRTLPELRLRLVPGSPNALTVIRQGEPIEVVFGG